MSAPLRKSSTSINHVIQLNATLGKYEIISETMEKDGSCVLTFEVKSMKIPYRKY